MGEPRETVVREFTPIGRYRCRLLDEPKHGRSWDLREYVRSPSWEGYSRRGVRFSDRAQIELLRDTLTEVLMLFPEPQPAKK